MLNPQEAKLAIQRLFRRSSVAKLDALYRVLKTRSRMSVFRRLKEVGYLSSYTHTCRYYTLSAIPQFDAFGLWHYRDVGFSRAGTLKATMVGLVDSSSVGWTPRELQQVLHARVHNGLLDLVRTCKIRREPLAAKRPLYVSADKARASKQLAQRLRAGAGPGLPASGVVIEVLLDLVRAVAVKSTPPEVAHRLTARGVAVTVEQVRKVFDRYKLGGKKGARSPRSRP